MPCRVSLLLVELSATREEHLADALDTIQGAMICVHVGAKSCFVRILRGSPHLTSNSKTHWATWLGCTYGVGAAGWILSEAVPFFGSLVSDVHPIIAEKNAYRLIGAQVSLVGAVGFA